MRAPRRWRPRLLLIEDDPAMANMYARALTEYGYHVTLAFDGESGLAALRGMRPDLVLLDIRLPRLDGIVVLSQIRADADAQQLKVIALTNDGLFETMAACHELGVTDYVTKAMVTPRELGQIIARNLLAPTA